MKWQQGDYLISTNKSRLDVSVIHDYLSRESYWASGRSLEIVRKTIVHSLCFGVYREQKQVGFARVVTDFATFAWLCDVFILEGHHRLGLGKWLVECVTSYTAVQNINLWLLATKDAHNLYRRCGGFAGIEQSERWMIREKVDD